jgi:hypothetical protein
VLNVMFGLTPLFGHNIWLHAGTAALAAYFGYGRRSDVMGADHEHRRAA